jgi:hypothetical protein
MQYVRDEAKIMNFSYYKASCVYREGGGEFQWNFVNEIPLGSRFHVTSSHGNRSNECNALFHVSKGIDECFGGGMLTYLYTGLILSDGK